MMSHRSSIRFAAALLASIFCAIPTAGAYDGDLIESQLDVTPLNGNADATGEGLALVPNPLGNGLDALLVGRPNADIGPFDAGAVDVLFLGPGGTIDSSLTISEGANDPNNVLTIDHDNGFGYAVAYLGDLNGDGRHEIAVGAPTRDTGASLAGSVWVISLDSTTGVPWAAVEIASGVGGLPGGLISGNDRFGSAVAGLGDWDGDGVADLAVGARLDDVALTDQGSIYILYLNPDGTVKDYDRINASEGGFTGTLPAYARFGAAITLIADQNGDGRPDLAVGAPFDTGSVWLLEMAPGCFAVSPTCTVTGETEITDGTAGLDGAIGTSADFGDSLAWSPAASPLDTDRLLVGAPGYTASDTGAVWVIELSDGVISGSTRIADQEGWTVDLVNSDLFGAGVAALGDINADGISDFAFGARDLSTPGRVWTTITATCPTLILRPIVYHDPTLVGQDPCQPIALPSTATIELDLWIESAGVASTPAVACDASAGGGNEMCAWDVRLALEGAYSLDLLDAFVPDVALAGSVGESDASIMPKELRLNWVRSGLMAPQNGAVRLGTVRLVNDFSGDGAVKVAPGSAAVGASLQYQRIGERTIGVPEPGFAIALVLGVVVLAGLRSRRTRVGARWRAAAFVVVFVSTAGVADQAEAQSIKNQIRISEGENFFPGSRADAIGRSLAFLDDLDDDGTTDIAFGCCSVAGFNYPERIFVQFLGANGAPPGSPNVVESFGTVLGDLFADSMDTVPDRDGDGIVELIVGGAPPGGFPGALGNVSMIFLNANGTRKNTKIDYAPGLGGGFVGPLGIGADRFGDAVAWLGDSDGNLATSEFVVGAPADETAGPNNGAIWVISLDATNTVVGETKITSAAFGLGNTVYFGEAMSAIRDLDGNGVADLAIGARQCFGTIDCLVIVSLGPDGGGGTQVVGYTVLGPGYGGLPYPLPTSFRARDITWVNDVPETGGGVMAVGDTDGSVYMIHILADRTARDFYRIYEGAGVGETLGTPWSDAGFGSAVQGVGDVDEDDIPDLVVGASGAQKFGGGTFSVGQGAIHIFHMIDSDKDGLDDELDNCPGGPLSDPELFYNPRQLDADGDGVGDLCDVCPNVPDPLQSNIDGDAYGDLCEPARVLLQSTGTLASPSWDLLLECGAYDVTEANLALVPPTGAAAPAFTFACPAPPAGGQCATLDGVSSTESGPGLGAPAGVRGDAIYVEAAGNGTGGVLCEALDPPAKIGELTTGAITSASAVAAAALSEEGVGIPGLGVPIVGTSGGPVPIEQVELVTGGPIPRATIRLGPAVVDGGNTRWDVILFEAPDRFHRVTFGLVAPAGTSTADMRFVGCDTAAAGAGEVRTCGVGVGPTVDALQSWTVGPTTAANTPAGLHEHTLYAVLEGALPFFVDPTRPYMNIPGQTITLGTVELTGTPDLEPALTLEGVDLIDDVYGTGAITPYERTQVGALANLDEVRLVGQFNPAEDEDGDGIQNLADNCPYGQNANQLDSGGFQDGDPDGLGDVCQCGDASRNGVVDGDDPMIDPEDDDLAQMRDYLLGRITAPLEAADVEARCSVSSGTGCDIRDLYLLQEAIDGGPSIQTRCDAALSPGPGS